MTFDLMFVYIFFVWFGLLNGHHLGIAAHSVDHMFSLYFDHLEFWLFPRFGF